VSWFLREGQLGKGGLRASAIQSLGEEFIAWLCFSDSLPDGLERTVTEEQFVVLTAWLLGAELREIATKAGLSYDKVSILRGFLPTIPSKSSGCAWKVLR
jgi:hypothetical protein